MQHEQWICPLCGFKNRPQNTMCGGTGPMGCKAQRPAGASGGFGAPYGGGGSQFGGQPFGGQPFGGQPFQAFGQQPFGGMSMQQNQFGQSPFGWQGMGTLSGPSGGYGKGQFGGGMMGGKGRGFELQGQWWVCDNCGFKNRPANTVCGGTGPMGCKKPRGTLTTVAQSAEVDRVDDDGKIPPREPGTLRLVTFNVSNRDVDEKRVKEVAKILRECDADAVAVQELSPEFIQFLVTDEVMARFKVLVQEPRTGYFTALFLHPDSSFHDGSNTNCCLPFDVTTMTRGLQYSDVVFPDFGTVRLATCHLESPKPRETGSRLRQEQLAQVMSALQPAASEGRNTVLLGDFNWMKSDGDMALQSGWTDAWSELRGSEKGPTFHDNKGPLCTTAYRGDRVLTHGLKVDSITRLGVKAIEGSSPQRFPSDHYALLAVVRVPDAPNGTEAPDGADAPQDGAEPSGAPAEPDASGAPAPGAPDASDAPAAPDATDAPPSVPDASSA